MRETDKKKEEVSDPKEGKKKKKKKRKREPVAPARREMSRMALISLSVSVLNLLMATTTGTPNLSMFLMWTSRFLQPSVTSSMFSVRYSPGMGIPATTLGPPP